MRRIVITASLLAAAGIVAGILLARSSDGVASKASHTGSTLDVARGAAFEVGVEHVYDVSLAQTARAGTGAADFRVAIHGSWAVAYAGQGERGLVFRAQLRDAKSERGDVDARPYFFTTTPAGRLIAMQFATDVNERSRGVLTTLAATFQVTRDGGDVVESDTIGDYEARYVHDERGLHRHRVKYQRVVGGGAIAATIVTTGTDIALRGDGWVDRMAGTEVTRVGTIDVGVTVDARFAIRHRSFARVTVEKPAGDIVAVDAASGALRTEQADRDLVDGATLADLLAGFASLGDDSHARGYQYLRIAALLRLDPEAVRAAERMVIDGASNAQLLIAALGEAGSPAAQTALGDVLGSAAAEESRTHAAISLGLTESPTPATLAALDSAMQAGGDVAASAMLAQGNAALRMRDEDPAAASRQVDALLARLGRASTDEERALVLRALGNTGDAKIIPALERALTSANPIVRVAATEALRLAPGVDAIVVTRFADESALVRTAAVFAASQRDLAAFVGVFDLVVRKDPDVDVRRAIVELAGARIADSAALHSVVEYAAANDRDADLRATAQRLLAPS